MAKPPSKAAANYEEPDFDFYKSKEPTPTQTHFTDWVIEKCGLSFATKKEESAFRNGVSLGIALRGIHQASPENQERLRVLREAREAAAAEEAANPKPKKAEAAAAPVKAAKATKAAKAAAPVETEAAPAETAPTRAPAKRGRRGAAAASTVAPF